MSPRASTGPAARKARKANRQSRRRHEFLDAAGRALREHGLVALTLADVAREAGETESLLYYYFANREALLIALAVDNILVDIERMREAVVAAPTGVEAIQALIRALVDRYRDDLETFKLRMWVSMRRLPKEILHEKLYPGINGVVDAVEAKITADQRAGAIDPDLRPRVRAGVAMTQAEGLLMNYALIEGVGAQSDIELDTMVEEACHQAAYGIVARGD